MYVGNLAEYTKVITFCLVITFAWIYRDTLVMIADIVLPK